MSDLLLYGVFAAIVAVLLAIDLFVVQRNTHAVSLREAGVWTAIWIGMSVVFGLTIARFHPGDGGNVTLEYFTGYVIEKSLSVDNIFVFVLIFQSLSVPREYQHRVLFYGVLGAIVMRTALIFAGAALIQRFSWILYGFGAFLLYVAYKTWRKRKQEPHIAESGVLRRIRRVLPTTDDYREQRFFVREQGRLLATPLFAVLVLVEVSDLVFAVDSIPAIFAITRDPFVVLTSNIFAILGLRSLYFLLVGAADRLHYLRQGLALILAFVGLKLLTENLDGLWHPGPLASLGFILAILAVVIALSLRHSWKHRPSRPAADECGDPRAFAASAVDDLHRRLDAEESSAGHEPW